jgi:hypothetical protein
VELMFWEQIISSIIAEKIKNRGIASFIELFSIHFPPFSLV